jgi:hypothetical protein
LSFESNREKVFVIAEFISLFMSGRKKARLTAALNAADAVVNNFEPARAAVTRVYNTMPPEDKAAVMALYDNIVALRDALRKQPAK